MTAAEIARARHRLYALLGRLLVEGPTDEALSVAAAIPAFAPFVGTDPHELAAGHYAALTEVPPVLSAVLGEDGLVGGHLADVVRERYRATGYYPGRTDVPPDHLGMLLGCAAHLCAVEAEAHDDGLEAGYVHDLQRSLLDDQLLSWLPAWVVAVRGASRTSPARSSPPAPLFGLPAPPAAEASARGAQPGEAFWVTVAELALELCVSHRASLGGKWRPWRPSRPLPDLDDPGTGLADLGAALVRPSASGWLAGRRAVGRVCLAAGVPAGFGDRGRVLGDALRAAADLRRLPILLGALRSELDGWTDALASLGELPVAGWVERARATAALLDRVRAAAETPAATR